jgi:hypothetical protein
MNSVHQVAEQVTRAPRVVYVDNDPVVISHAQALLTTPRTVAIHADLTRPDEILSAAEDSGVLDFSQPVAILLVAVLHFIPDSADPAKCVATLREVMAPGSCLVLSHVEMSPGQVVDSQPQTEAARELGEARKGMSSARARTRDEVTGFFGELTLVEPGLTEVWNWRPDAESVMTPSEVLTLLGGVGRKD